MSGRCLSLLSVVQALFINLHPWVHPNRNRGWKQGQGGVDGCRAVAPVTTRDLLPGRLPVCPNADLCHALQTRDCFLTKYKHKQEHMHRHTDTEETHALKNTHASKPAKGKQGVTKDRQCPLVFSSKRNQTKSTNHHPWQNHKNRYRRGAREKKRG